MSLFTGVFPAKRIQTITPTLVAALTATPKRTGRHLGANPGRTFRPDVCCEHEWHNLVTAEGALIHHECHKCGATCKRDGNGAIVEYDAFPAYPTDFTDGL